MSPKVQVIIHLSRLLCFGPRLWHTEWFPISNCLDSNSKMESHAQNLL